MVLDRWMWLRRRLPLVLPGAAAASLLSSLALFIGLENMDVT